MKKAIFVFLLLIAVVSGISAREIPGISENANDPEIEYFDIVLQYYLPGWFGFSNGKDTQVFGFKNNPEPEWIYSGDIEERFLIHKFNKISLSASFMAGGVMDDKNTILRLSGGIGAYYNPTPETFSLSGPFVYFYPVYGLPSIRSEGAEFVSKWRMALDIGGDIEIAELFKITYYFRNLFVWFDDSFSYFPDIGLAVGLRLHDPLIKPQEYK